MTFFFTKYKKKVKEKGGGRVFKELKRISFRFLLNVEPE